MAITCCYKLIFGIGYRFRICTRLGASSTLSRLYFIKE